MTSNTSPSGIASASSEWNSSFAPYRAFDGEAHYGWATRSGTSGWISYEFEPPTVVNAYVLKTRSMLNGSTEAPKDWTQAWNRTESIILDTRSDISDWKNEPRKEFSFSNVTPYKKYRLNVTKNNGYAEVKAFINWYDAKDAGSGPSKYAINKNNNNKGPFSKRTDYIIFNNILMFEVSEYATVTSATYQ